MEILPRERRIEALLDQRFEWTARQRDVLDLIARGKTNQEVADTLGISLDGAKWHMREILSKLGVDTREEAAEYWRRRNGWLRRTGRLVGGLTGTGVAKWSVAGAAVLSVAVAAILIGIALETDDQGEAPTSGDAGPIDLGQPLHFRGTGGFTGDFTVWTALPHADVVVRGRITAVRDGNRDTRPEALAMTYRVAEVHITETLAGEDPGDTVEVFVPGGTDGMVTVHVSDWGPALAAGEDVILFLSEPGSFEALPPGLWIAGVDFKIRGQWAIDAIDAQLPVEELTRQIIAAGRR